MRYHVNLRSFPPISFGHFLRRRSLDAFPCQHPPTHHPDPGPKRSRPTFCQQHETYLGRAVACLADWPSAKRPRSIRTSILSSESSTHPPEPVSELTMVRKRKERVACSAQYHEEQERRRESQRTTVNLWRKRTRHLRGRRTTPIE
jgi:hypothetical protein